MGVANHSASADFSGKLCLSISDPSGRAYNIDTGTAFSLKKISMSLLSVSEPLRNGSLLLFKSGKSFEANNGSPRIPMIGRDGLFPLVLTIDFLRHTSSVLLRSLPFSPSLSKGTLLGEMLTYDFGIDAFVICQWTSRRSYTSMTLLVGLLFVGTTKLSRVCAKRVRR